MNVTIGYDSSSNVRVMREINAPLREISGEPFPCGPFCQTTFSMRNRLLLVIHGLLANIYVRELGRTYQTLEIDVSYSVASSLKLQTGPIG